MRSANRGNGYNAWNVNPSGNVNNNNAANNSLTLAPDCTGQRRHGWIIDQAATVNSTGSRIPGPEGQNNTNPIPPSCGRGGYTRCGLIKMNQEEIIGFEALYQSMQQCKKGVMWKGSVAHYVLNGLEETYKLSQQLKDGTYKPRKPSKFTVYSPKQRDIVSISFKDRVYQRSLNDNGIYDGMTRSFIEDNQACQKGKGTDRARDRMEELLRRAFRKHGADFYILQCDVHGYYKHMRHNITEQLFQERLDPDVAMRAVKVMREQYTETDGYNPGSQVIQIAGISYLDSMDHFVKERLRIKGYIRYMDDFLLIHNDPAYLQYCLKEITQKLSEVGLEPNTKKTRILKAADGVMFLGFTFRVTRTGKILRLIDPQNVKRERKRLVRMVGKARRGELTRKKVDECYQAWKAHAEKGNTQKLLKRMDEFYADLWRSENAVQTRAGSERAEGAGAGARSGGSE